MWKYLLAISIGLVLFSCKSEQAEDQPEVPTETEVEPTITGDGKTILVSNIEYLRLRSIPGPDGEILDNLGNGAELEYLGEMSNFSTEVSLRGIRFNEPWLRVRSVSGNEGWVFAGALSFKLDGSSALPEQLLDIRLKSLFGESLASEMKSYRQAYSEAKTDQDLSNSYQEGTNLRESVNGKLEDIIRITDYENLPDLFWLEQALPAFQPQLVAEGTLYHLFHNYKTWKVRAHKTAGGEDESFFDLCQHLYQVDSIEYFWPDYFLQTWDYGGHSELGAGKHLALLQKMDQTIRVSPSFAAEIENFKADLVNDILGPDITYWNDQTSILVELDDILSEELLILREADKVALQQRRTQFAEFDKHSIKVDFKSGMVE